MASEWQKSDGGSRQVKKGAGRMLLWEGIYNNIHLNFIAPVQGCWSGAAVPTGPAATDCIKP